MRDYPPNFSRQELLRSNTAIELGLSNEPDTQQEEDNLLRTAWFLQELRDKLCKHYGTVVPLVVTSGFRNEQVNNAVGGSRTSAHRLGLAADVVPRGISVAELGDFIVRHMTGYDQIIYEFGRWIHVGLADTPRGQYLKAYRDANRRVVYSPIISAVKGK